jgi:hypothetical protein
MKTIVYMKTSRGEARLSMNNRDTVTIEFGTLVVNADFRDMRDAILSLGRSRKVFAGEESRR